MMMLSPPRVWYNFGEHDFDARRAKHADYTHRVCVCFFLSLKDNKGLMFFFMLCRDELMFWSIKDFVWI